MMVTKKHDFADEKIAELELLNQQLAEKLRKTEKQFADFKLLVTDKTLELLDVLGLEVR